MNNLLVEYTVKPERLATAMEIIATFVENIAEKEPEALIYRAMQESEDPYRFVHFMIFSGDEAEDRHRITTHVKTFVESLYPICREEPVFRKLDLVANAGALS